MYVPDRLHERRFADWNYLLRGLVEVWELARWLHVERAFEEALRTDSDGLLAEEIGRIGNSVLGLSRFRDEACGVGAQALLRHVVTPLYRDRLAPLLVPTGSDD